MKNLIIGIAVGIMIGIGIGYLIWGRTNVITLSGKGIVMDSSSNDTTRLKKLVKTLDKTQIELQEIKTSQNIQLIKDLDETKKILLELQGLSVASFKGRDISDTIPYQLAVDRRAKFKQLYPTIANNVLRTYFEVEIKDIKELMLKSPVKIRMYPILEERPDKHIYTWALIGVDTLDNNITSVVVDVINPCPPPIGCKEL